MRKGITDKIVLIFALFMMMLAIVLIPYHVSRTFDEKAVLFEKYGDSNQETDECIEWSTRQITAWNGTKYVSVGSETRCLKYRLKWIDDILKEHGY